MKPVVAIDGPSGSGKSSVARLLAQRLGYQHLDTGAMYRAVALAAFRKDIPYDDARRLDELCASISIDLDHRGEELVVYLDGEDVTDHIRTPEMSLGSSAVSALPEVRQHMVRLQQFLGRNGAMVAEGRDMGTVVFPDTPAKFYLDASLTERARRRWLQLREQGMEQAEGDVLSQLKTRDRNDTNRSHSPLKRAGDATYIDTTAMSLEEVVDTLSARVTELESVDA
ncbi:MAG: (d)CMP kinase [bacterium]|nr:(d)CMP kinase [bacterium]MDT8395719.1 (d)CMP kinase [bacterium]